MGADPSGADSARDRAMASDGQHYVDASREMPFEGMTMQQQPVPMAYTQPAEHPQMFMRGARLGEGYSSMPGPELQPQVHPQLRTQMQPQVQAQTQPELQSLRALEQVERANQRVFDQRQIQEVWQVIDFNKHQLPLPRIKRIMKDDQGVKMIAAEAPGVLSKAGEMFVLDLTRRSWGQTEWNNRRTLQRSHIASAAREKDYFDFLVDIIRSRVEIGQDDGSA